MSSDTSSKVTTGDATSIEDRKLIDKISADDALALWELEQSHEASIENEIKQTQPLLGGKEPISVLVEAYNTNESADYLRKAQDLSENYSHIRRVRGDGNCFYRALLFAQLERILDDAVERKRFIDVSKGWRQRLFALGFPEFTTGDFCDWFEELLEDINRGQKTLADIETVINDDGPSNYYVTFLRLVTSGYLQENAEQFQGFIDGGRSIVEYCRCEVEPMWHECDHVCITSLVQALGISIRIEYMDRSEAPSGGWHHDFVLDNQQPALYFLYRPGHYDILKAVD